MFDHVIDMGLVALLINKSIVYSNQLEEDNGPIKELLAVETARSLLRGPLHG